MEVKKKINPKKWLDECALSLKGVFSAAKNRHFWIGFLLNFVIFGTLMNLIAGGSSKFKLMWAGGPAAAARIIWESFIALFGISQTSADWLLSTFIVVLQSILIGLLVFLATKKSLKTPKSPEKHQATLKGSQKSELKPGHSNSQEKQNAGLITGLVALGAGCPTCGTTLIAALCGSLFSTGSLAFASIAASALTILAVIIALLSIRRLGLEAYVLAKSELYEKRHKNPESPPKASRAKSLKNKAETL